MGQEFIQTNSACAELMVMAENVCNRPLGKVCAEGPMEELTQSANLQPAITATNLICWKAFQDAAGKEFEISCFAGHSLGEYSALYAGGIIGADDALRLVAKRGALMQREGDKNPGGMRAVVGIGIKDVEAIIAECQDKIVTIANHNTPEQIVISGTMAGLDAAAALAEAKGAKVIALNVSVANHSPLVSDAVPDFREFLGQIPFSSPKMPVYFNVSAAKETDPSVMKDMMSRQIASRVRWCEIIQSMLAEGVDTFIEVGPKAVLKGMMKKLIPKGRSVTTLQFDSPATLTGCLDKLRGA
jgi:[acyl-carrier-protein] S-malonyltransferase